MTVCLFASITRQAHGQTELRQYLGAWFGPPLAAFHMLRTSGFVDAVMCSHNGPVVRHLNF